MDAINAKVTINLSSIEDDRTTLDGEVLFDHNDQPDEIEIPINQTAIEAHSGLDGGFLWQ
ncbi:MAG: hypothetical protein IID42_03545 [Planctomycetes bacterium]|nr:hypothetical protein [Planctomycetota bacterium]